MSKKNPQMNNGHVPNMSNLGPQPSFQNFPNQFHSMQSNHPGMPQFGVTPSMFQGQFPPGFVPQNTQHNFQMQRPFFNMDSNVNPQFFMHNPQQLNQNIGVVPYGQFHMHTPIQFNPMQMLNATQVGPYFAPSCPSPMLMGYPNQIGQAMGQQNHAFNPNIQPSLVHGNPNLQNAVHPSLTPIPNQISQGNPSASVTHHSAQSPQTKNNSQHMRPQANHVEGRGNRFLKSYGNQSKNQNFNRNSNGENSHCRFQNAQFNQKNAKKHSVGLGSNGRKGNSNDRLGNHGQATNRAKVQEKRSITVNYTEQEVQQWREERKKSYPSKDNINKKLTKTEAIDREAKLRRMRLKEILAKQAELGIEVAEIPPQYLSDSEKQLHRKKNNRNLPHIKDRFERNRNKRGRYNQRDVSTKKQKWDKSSNSVSSSTQKPTLLQKLLSADIKKEKSHLLQVFRFMVMNSFFRDASEKSLKFPLVLLKDDKIKEIDETLFEEFDDDDDLFDNDDAQVEKKACLGDGNAIEEENKSSLEDEEEGEIV